MNLDPNLHSQSDLECILRGQGLNQMPCPPLMCEREDLVGYYFGMEDERMHRGLEATRMFILAQIRYTDFDDIVFETDYEIAM